MKALAQSLLIVLLISFTYVASASAQGKLCAAVVNKSAQEITNTQNRLDKIFAENFRNESMYTCYECHNNVVKLFKAFKEQIPELKAEDFKVLFIAPEQWVTYSSILDFDRAKVRRARYKYEPKYMTTSIGFKYHVVLEYYGRIYDLDYTSQPTPVSKKEYLEDNFYSKAEIDSMHVDQLSLNSKDIHNLDKYNSTRDKSRDELQVVVVPSADYLNYDFAVKRKQDFFQNLIGKSKEFTYSLVGYFLN